MSTPNIAVVHSEILSMFSKLRCFVEMQFQYEFTVKHRALHCRAYGCANYDMLTRALFAGGGF